VWVGVWVGGGLGGGGQERQRQEAGWGQGLVTYMTTGDLQGWVGLAFPC
jgi:hypothetical protein